MKHPPGMLKTIFLIAYFLFFSSNAIAGRLALVIGNANYLESPLKNPINDARAISDKLKQLEFKVTTVENLRKEDIGRTISSFVSSVRPGDEVVFFYAGHGQQIKGTNYLTAVNAQIRTEDDVPLNGLNLNSLVDRLNETSASVKLFFIDACRNNPFTRGFRSPETGLARMSGIPTGTLMHFATRPGGVAADGVGINSLYTSTLLKHIDAVNTPIESILKKVATSVTVESRGTQEPWVEGNILGEFYFKTQVAINTPSGSQSANSDNVSPQPIIQPPSISLVKVSAPDAATAKMWAEKSSENINSGNWIEAIRTSLVSLSFDPNNTNALINICAAYIARKDYQEATNNCMQALRLDPRNSIVRNNIGVIQAASGEIDNALINYQASCLAGLNLACENFKKIKGYAPNDHESVKRIMNDEAAKLLDAKRYDEAIAACDKLLKIYPSNAVAYVIRSAANAYKGSVNEAVEDANKAIRIDPNMSTAYNNRGFANQLAGNTKSALLDYEIACSLKFDLACNNLRALSNP